jgi:hypothetical protein
MDKTGKVIAFPMFDQVKPFLGGVAAVRVGGKMGFIRMVRE